MTTLIGALLIGTTMGLLGSGGSAITVPILVYLVGHDAKISIAESMAIVGIISLVGSIPKAAAKYVDWPSVIWFGLPAMAGTYVGAWLGGRASDALQLSVFGIIVIFAAIFMLRNAFSKSNNQPLDEQPKRPPHNFLTVTKIVTEGMTVGMITGFVGVGGGFIIVPALMMLEKLPIRTAIGTSMIIIAMKSAIGFTKYHFILEAQGLSIDLQTIVVFSVIGLAGCAIGQKMNTKFHQATLKKIFAIFLVLIGGFVIIREGGKLLNYGNEETVSQVDGTAIPLQHRPQWRLSDSIGGDSMN